MRVGLGGVGDVRPARLIDAELVEQRAELRAILGAVDALGAGAEDAARRPVQAAARGCSASARPC